MKNKNSNKKIKKHEQRAYQAVANAEQLHKLAQMCIEHKLFAKAQQHLSEILRIYPHHPQIMNDLAVVLDIQGKTVQACSMLKQVIALAPSYQDPYTNLGKIYTTLGKLAIAEEMFEQVIAINPNNILAINNLAGVYMQTNRKLKALDYIKSALKLNANDLMALTNYGRLLRHFSENTLAKNVYNKIISIEPNNVNALAELAILHSENNQFGQAFTLINKALTLDPNNYYANYYATLILFYDRQYELIERYATKAFAIKGTSLELLGIHGMVQLSLGEYDNFATTQRLAHELVDSGKYYELADPFIAQVLFTDNLIQKKIAHAWGNIFIEKLKTSPYQRINYNHKKLHIGYISADFGNHPVGMLVENIFKLHNRSEFKIYGFPTKKHNCARFDKICQQFDECILLDPTNAEHSARLINACEIDILIDLVGATKNDNYDILALQPATIQCHTIGYTGTLAADYLQYYITTKIAVPEHMLEAFTEKIVYMPYAEVCHPGFVIDPKSISRQEYNLPEDKFVFLAHHSPYRLTKEVLLTWCRILQAVPNSVLWILYKYDKVKQSIIHLAKQYDIEENRLIFYSNEILTDSWQHRLADLFLDNFSHTSGTLSFLCAFAGLPMLTYLGDTPQSRVCASFCHAAGVPQQVVATKQEYFERAVYLANNKKELHNIQQQLLTNLPESKLFNQPLYVKHLEQAYKLMWDDFCQNTNHKTITISTEHQQ